MTTLYKVTNVGPKQTDGMNAIQRIALSLLAESGYKALASTISKGVWGEFVERGLEIQGTHATLEDRTTALDAFVEAVKTEALSTLLRDMAHGLGLDKASKAFAKPDEKTGSITGTEKAAINKAINYRNRIASAWKAGIDLTPAISTGKLEQLKREAEAKVAAKIADKDKPAHTRLQEQGKSIADAAELVSKMTATVQAPGMAAAADMLLSVNRLLVALGSGTVDVETVATLTGLIEGALPQEQANEPEAAAGEQLADIPEDEAAAEPEAREAVAA